MTSSTTSLDPQLDSTPPRTLRFVLGPVAAADAELRAAVGRLRDMGRSIDVRLTWEEGDARRWAREAAESGVDTVVAAGGDGTLNEVVNGIYEADDARCALGILPFGTANDFAESLGLPLDEKLLALRPILDGRRLATDVGRVGDRRFLNMATGGFGAEVTAETHKGMKAALGSFAYLLAGLARMGELEAHSLSVRGPDFEWSGEAFAVAIGNGCQAGGGIALCPDALLDDGLLDLTIVPAMPVAQLVTYMGEALLTGSYVTHDAVIYHQLPWIEIESDGEMQLNLDGEPVRDRSFRLELETRQLPIHRPDPASPDDGAGDEGTDGGDGGED